MSGLRRYAIFQLIVSLDDPSANPSRDTNINMVVNIWSLMHPLCDGSAIYIYFLNNKYYHFYTINSYKNFDKPNFLFAYFSLILNFFIAYRALFCFIVITYKLFNHINCLWKSRRRVLLYIFDKSRIFGGKELHVIVISQILFSEISHNFQCSFCEMRGRGWLHMSQLWQNSITGWE